MRTIALDDLETWINGDPPLDDDCRRLLAAYREALSQANAPEISDRPANSPDADDESEDKSQPPQHEYVAPDPQTPSAMPSKAIPQPPRVRFVPRLAQIEGVTPDQLGPLHGQLIAMGYLSEELLGRTGGIVYRVTRDGICRLNQVAGDREAGGETGAEAGERENQDSRAA